MGKEGTSLLCFINYKEGGSSPASEYVKKSDILFCIGKRESPYKRFGLFETKSRLGELCLYNTRMFNKGGKYLKGKEITPNEVFPKKQIGKCGEGEEPALRINLGWKAGSFEQDSQRKKKGKRWYQNLDRKG